MKQILSFDPQCQMFNNLLCNLHLDRIVIQHHALPYLTHSCMPKAKQTEANRLFYIFGELTFRTAQSTASANRFTFLVFKPAIEIRPLSVM
jgi:hypothetical protein